ncbi:uncharacterized protein LOC107773588 isoform X1 [Nicotiana tabacum]|uniref:Uncharacterized protein LOC107773588 isoform X1 n=6 Tax=Nicotiana tabacum TaxID=4097 RepID=A0AC58S0J4_TOBAC|nr:PREDICTED: uncharacterized protein LOC107773588 isoform X1 [Nicotiana tabacum]
MVNKDFAVQVFGGLLFLTWFGYMNEVVKELGSFLGTLARNGTFCPLNIFNWRKLDTKDDMCKYIKAKYDILEEAKPWVFHSIQVAWRKYKNQLKKDYFEYYANDELRMENRPVDVSESHFKDLLNYWNSDSHKILLSSVLAVAVKFIPIIIFSLSIHVGYSVILLRLLYCVVRTVLFSVTTVIGNLIIWLFIPVLGAIEDRMQQKMEEMEERMQQRMLEKFNAHKDAWEQEITLNVVSQLRRMNSGLQIDPNMLNFSVRSPGEALSAQQNVIQLINRLSTDSNNRGGENGEREDGDIGDLDLT